MKIIRQHTRIKFCGFTRSEDVQAAVQAGADALGFVFYAPSPRAVTVAQARELMADVPAFVSRVALVVNASEADMAEIATLPIDMIQFHGDETPAACKKLAQGVHKNCRWIKALQVKPDVNLNQQAKDYAQAGASAILLDGYDPSQPELKGGTGKAVDWHGIQQFVQSSALPVILAGGLTPENVASAITQAKPYAVDVSGGIEAVNTKGNKLKGVKDAGKMLAFARVVLQDNL